MPEIGDILFEGIHPAIICGHDGQLKTAEMDNEGPILEIFTPRSNARWFRCKNKALASTASEYAVAWCYPIKYAKLPGTDDVSVNGAPLTPYASRGLTGRYYGWQAHHYSGETAPLGHDALYRAFKWAGRLEKPLSEEKGFSCDVFVCACFHAAAIALLYKGDLAKIQAKANLLGVGRSAQKALRADRHELNKSPKSGSAYENSVLRAWSNAGPLPKQDPNFLAHWKSTLNDGAILPIALEDIFTGALLVDAKFTHGAQMMSRMEADGQWWQRV